MILIGNQLYQIINVLFLLMNSAGATPVAGMNGTTSSFLQHSTHVTEMRQK